MYDVTDGRLVGPRHECGLDEGEERSVVHVQLVDFVEDGIDESLACNVLRLERNHVVLKTTSETFDWLV